MHSKPFSWQIAWDYPAFRLKLIIGIIILIFILLFIPQFFRHIESREGYVLNDWLLARIPAINVSAYIFILLYAMVIFLIFRMSRNTSICLTALWSFVFLCFARILTITMVPLNPPTDIIVLADPCSVLFYHANVITKDLFFSGHTATLFIGGLCLTNKRDKIIAFTASGIIGFLLLLQHVHYTADVLAAPFFCWICWYLGKSVAKL